MKELRSIYSQPLTEEMQSKGCWSCPHRRSLDPETNKCMLSGTTFEDRLELAYSRLPDCPRKEDT